MILRKKLTFSYIYFMNRFQGNIRISYGILLLTIIIGLLFTFYGYEETWQLWGIPTLSPEFADLRTITGGAESARSGYDPLVENPADPWQRPMNYPRVWQSLFLLNIDQSHTVYLGVSLIIFFFAGLLLFFKDKYNFSHIFLILLTVFSPAVMLTLERGNIDLIIFFLISLAVFFANKNYKFSKLFSFLAIAFGFILKLYPIFAIIVFIREKSSVFLSYLILMIIMAGLYTLITYSDLALILENTPKDLYLSYGINVLWQTVSNTNITMGLIVRMLSYFMIIISFIVLRFGYLETVDLPENTNSNSVNGYLAGAGIYIGTFLIGNNFDYRLIFLLFTIPQFLYIIKSYEGAISKVAIISFVSLLISLWHLVLNKFFFVLTNSNMPSFLIDELANWTLFFGLIYLIPTCTRIKLFLYIFSKNRTRIVT